MLTYQEAVRAGARMLRWSGPIARAQVTAVLEAVGYADLLTEVENLRLTVGEDVWIMDRDDAEVERLHSWAGLMELLDEHWPADIWPMLEDDQKADAGHRVTSAMRWIERLRGSADAWWTEYDRELKAHEATKAEVERLRDGVTVTQEAVRAARVAAGGVMDGLALRYAPPSIREERVVAAIIAAFGLTVTDTPDEKTSSRVSCDCARTGRAWCCMPDRHTPTEGGVRWND